MKKKNLQNDTKDQIRCVRFWMATFILLVISAILFIFCFIFERSLWLYAICLIVFLGFVCTYVRADKAIKLKDGYSLIQAMHFFLVCLKAGGENSQEGQDYVIYEIAQKYEYAKRLKPHQVESMHRIGCELVRHFKLERFSQYV